MNIAVVDTCVPFVRGGGEHFGEALREQLAARGHNALPVRIPFRSEPAEQVLDHLLACRLLTLPRIERVIALRFPAYCVPHPNKVVWLLNPFQLLYADEDIRQVVVNADNLCLSQARRVFTNSQAAAERLGKFKGIAPEVLHAPLARSEHFFCSGYGDYFLFPEWAAEGKRQALVIEALKHVKSRVRLVKIPSNEEEKARLFAAALGCIYTPYNEDSCSDLTLEAYHSRKPVITCQDSGGVKILARHGETGLVVEPEPSAIADAMDELFHNRDRAAKMGNTGFELMMASGIHWDNAIEKLLA
ncbi:MAG: glycosyltransferase [Bryobacteraceae bacterium]|jgi:hypothetical protein